MYKVRIFNSLEQTPQVQLENFLNTNKIKKKDIVSISYARDINGVSYICDISGHNILLVYKDRKHFRKEVKHNDEQSN